MGLAASQARALLLVARKSDLEYRQQCLTQRKMVLAMQTEQIAKDYSTKISNRALKFVFNLNANDGSTINEDFTYSSLMAYNPDFVGQYRIADSRGNVVISSLSEIPKTEKYVPVYTLCKNGEQQYSSEPVYSEVSADKTAEKLSEQVELYAKSYDDSGKEIYVKVQESTGTKIEDAEVLFKDTNTKTKVFSKSGDDFVLNSNITLYTKTANPDPITSTTNDASAWGEGYEYVQTGYKKVYEDPVQQEDGNYYTSDGKKYVVCSLINNKEYFQNGIRTGAFLLQQGTTAEVKNNAGIAVGEKTTWATTPWQGSSVIKDEYNTEDDALAESEYEAKLAVIKCQDQMMDMEIKQIETQHKAIEEEWDSVKKVIEGNIQKTFKIFG